MGNDAETSGVQTLQSADDEDSEDLDSESDGTAEHEEAGATEDGASDGAEREDLDSESDGTAEDEETGATEDGGSDEAEPEDVDPESEIEENEESMTERIVDGATVLQTEPPNILNKWYVVISYGTERGHCGGALIKQKRLKSKWRAWVLTAAHCVQGHDISALTVRFGVNNWKTMGSKTSYTIEKAVYHEKYKNLQSHIDLAVLSVKTDGKLSTQQPTDFDIETVKLASSKQPEKQWCYVVGFGARDKFGRQFSWNNGVSGILKVAKMFLYPADTCDKLLGNGKKMSAHHFCAGRTWDTTCNAPWCGNGPSSAKLEDGAGNTCGGDSGGPMVCMTTKGRYELKGVVSYGAISAGAEFCERHANYFIKVFKYKQWIEDTLNEWTV